MPKKQFAGQLNMFDFFQSENYNEDGSLMEGEMVSLIPEDFSPEKSEIVDQPPENIKPEMKVSEKKEPKKESIEKQPIEKQPIEKHPIEKQPIEKLSIEKEHVEKDLIEKKHPQKEHTKDAKNIVMGHHFKDASGKHYRVAYVNYKEVLLEEGKDTDGVHSFETTQEAVSFYVDQLNRLQELNLKEITDEK
ncbi:MAG: hypothetical protein MR356_09710 [Agathobacter sp.]|nr:hypothetical protein [Agathobacter sp.]